MENLNQIRANNPIPDLLALEAENVPTDLSSLDSFDWSEFFLSLAKKAANAAISLIIALLLLLIGWIIIKIIMFVVRKALEARKNMDATLRRWLISVIGAVLKIFLAIIFIDSLGVETLSIAGMIAAVGVAIGSALSGVVQNFAAGIIIIAIQPIKVGEWIKVSGVDGTVVAINVCTTFIVTFDNKLHIIPNIIFIKNPITNYSRQPKRRVDVIIGVPTDQKLEVVRKVITDALYACTTDGRVLEDPRAKVAVSSIDGVYAYLICTPWITNTNPENFVRVLWHFKETIVRAMKQAGLPFAVPNLHLYLHEGEPAASMAPPDAEEQIEELKHRLNSRSHSRNKSKQNAAVLTIDSDGEAETTTTTAAVEEEEKKPVAEEEEKEEENKEKKKKHESKPSSSARKHKHKDKKN